MLKIEARPGCTRKKACSSALVGPEKRIRTKEITSKLEEGLNFTVNVDFWFCNDDFCKKPEGKKRDFCSFSTSSKNGHFCHCPKSEDNILQKALSI